jgi:anti-sigma B factor antagonist
MMEVSGRTPPSGAAIIQGSTMDAQQTNGRGSAAPTDPPTRRAAGDGSPVSVRVHRTSCWTILEVDGEVDIQALPLVAERVGGDATRVVLDLHGVTFMDAKGLATLVDIQRRARGAGGCVRLVAPSHSVRRVLKLTGCDHVFATFDSLPPAMSAPWETDPEPAS